METASSLGLPVGCHFEPSDKELLLHFLNNKVHGLPLSCNATIECDLYRNEETWTQLFDQTKRTSSGGCVIWKGQNDKPVKAKLDPRESTETRIGFKRMFSYVPKEGSTSKAKGDWVMYKFRLDDSFLNKNNKLQPWSRPRLIRGNVNQEMRSSIVSEPYHKEQNDHDDEVDVGSEILKLLDQDWSTT
ncbi:NAC transcription factor ONAC010-like [Pyrus ussuriensis x Pyrus communis]|uniref:NAC transcription factor ONAC010-like n=1 Tax=Pyrus ussuriensis x Pyrus communis TaxID=2448454 RepID=A0A5N5FML1_9ROSA|nr:NAC transcription factor ONAC010-like [Pyrus ussuriensis x Pyrus communis]